MRWNSWLILVVAGLAAACSPSWELPADSAAAAAKAQPGSGARPGIEPTLEATRKAARRLLEPRLAEMPGLAVTVARGTEVLWDEGLGVADLATGAAATPDTRFRIYSVAKAITGTLAVRLAQKGIVDLDAPIEAYLDGLPGELAGVTLAQLLSHTAGVRHYARGEWARVSQRHCETARQGIEPFRNDPLLAPPGSAYAYSSHGFVLASAVLEAAAQLPFLELIQREILDPARMVDTVLDTPPYERPPAAAFYRPARFGRVQEERPWDNSCKWGAGGLLSTAVDLARFGLAVLGGDLLDEAGKDLLFTSGRLPDGSAIEYGLGWGVDPEIGIAAHSGGSPGGRSYLLLGLEDGVVVALAGNLEGERFTSEARALRDLFLHAGRAG